MVGSPGPGSPARDLPPRPMSAMIRPTRSSSRMSMSSRAGGSRASDEDGRTSVKVGTCITTPSLSVRFASPPSWESQNPNRHSFFFSLASIPRVRSPGKPLPPPSFRRKKKKKRKTGEGKKRKRASQSQSLYFCYFCFCFFLGRDDGDLRFVQLCASVLRWDRPIPATN